MIGKADVAEEKEPKRKPDELFYSVGEFITGVF
jgi:hypothetical protein